MGADVIWTGMLPELNRIDGNKLLGSLTGLLLLFLALGICLRIDAAWYGSLMPFSRPWIAMIVIVLAGSTWIGFFAYRNIQYANELWWQFSYMDDAPRFLRAFSRAGGSL